MLDKVVVAVVVTVWPESASGDCESGIVLLVLDVILSRISLELGGWLLWLRCSMRNSLEHVYEDFKSVMNKQWEEGENEKRGGEKLPSRGGGSCGRSGYDGVIWTELLK